MPSLEPITLGMYPNGSGAYKSWSNQISVVLTGQSITSGRGTPSVTTSQLFFDDFERASLTSAPQNGINWTGFGNNPYGSASISTAMPASGTRSIQMQYVGTVATQDSSVELRMSPCGHSFTEYCVLYWLFLPANFYHRNVTGSDNTKGIMQSWSGSYGAVASNQYLGFEYWPNGDGSSYLTFRSGRDGVDLGHIDNGGEAGSGEMFRLSERGKWIQYKVHIKLASGVGQTDGTVRAWKWVEGEPESELLFTKTNWGYSTRGNYIESFYFLGWSNSGFDETTNFYIDRFHLHDGLIDWESFS